MSVEDGAVTGLPAVLRPTIEGKSLIFKELQGSRKTGILSRRPAEAQEALTGSAPPADIPSASDLRDEFSRPSFGRVVNA
jgi:hypothetical protein